MRKGREDGMWGWREVKRVDSTTETREGVEAGEERQDRDLED